MKKQLLLLTAFIAVFLAAGGAFAQQVGKPDTGKQKAVQPPITKPQFKLDVSRQISFSIDNKLSLQVADVENYIIVKQQGGPQAISQSAQLSGAQITTLLQSFNRVQQAFQPVIDSVDNHLVGAYNKYYNDSKARFTADTTAKYHHK